MLLWNNVYIYIRPHDIHLIVMTLNSKIVFKWYGETKC